MHANCLHFSWVLHFELCFKASILKMNWVSIIWDELANCCIIKWSCIEWWLIQAGSNHWFLLFILFQWIGNLVTVDDWKYIWMTEGLTEYLSLREIRKIHSSFKGVRVFISWSTFYIVLYLNSNTCISYSFWLVCLFILFSHFYYIAWVVLHSATVNTFSTHNLFADRCNNMKRTMGISLKSITEKQILIMWGGENEDKVQISKWEKLYN